MTVENKKLPCCLGCKTKKTHKVSEELGYLMCLNKESDHNLHVLSVLHTSCEQFEWEEELQP